MECYPRAFLVRNLKASNGCFTNKTTFLQTMYSILQYSMSDALCKRYRDFNVVYQTDKHQIFYLLKIKIFFWTVRTKNKKYKKMQTCLKILLPTDSRIQNPCKKYKIQSVLTNNVLVQNFFFSLPIFLVYIKHFPVTHYIGNNVEKGRNHPLSTQKYRQPKKINNKKKEKNPKTKLKTETA